MGTRGRLGRLIPRDDAVHGGAGRSLSAPARSGASRWGRREAKRAAAASGDSRSTPAGPVRGASSHRSCAAGGISQLQLPMRMRYQRHPDAATAPLPHGYHRREPEKTVLHAIVREHLETFLAQARRLHGEGYPRFIEREFRRYVDCGLLCHGFARIRCPPTPMVILAFISDPPVVTKILRHLRLLTAPPPLAPARGATTAQLWGLDPPRHAHPDDPAGAALDPCHSPRPRPERDLDSEDAPLVARPPP